MQPLKDFLAEEIKVLKCAQTCVYKTDCNGSRELSFHFPKLLLKAEAHANPEPSTSSHLTASQGHTVPQTIFSVLDLQAKVTIATLEICTLKGSKTLNAFSIFPSILC